MSVHVERQDGLVDSYFDSELRELGDFVFADIAYRYEVDSMSEALRVLRDVSTWDHIAREPVLLRTEDAAYYRTSQWSTVKRD